MHLLLSYSYTVPPSALRNASGAPLRNADGGFILTL